jgi:rare lipoprotein A
MALVDSLNENRGRAIRAVLLVFALAAAAIAVERYLGSEKRDGPQVELSPHELPGQKPAIPRSDAAPNSEPSAAASSKTGSASWYEVQLRTASGEQMDASAMTAAHPSLPLGTNVLVENLSNGRSVVVRINDRGPFTGGRIIDVSKAAAVSLGMIDAGVATVRVSSLQGVPDAQTVTEANESERNPAVSAR